MLPAGTVTFLFTDIQGSTSLWERFPDEMAVALDQHNQILYKVFKETDGSVFKTVGDSFQVAFVQPGRALWAAVLAQRTLKNADWRNMGPLLVRMGIHTGPARLAGDDYATSHTLNRVSRIMSAGHGGQILVSLTTVEMVRDNLPEGVQLKNMGRHLLKGMSYPEHIFQVEAPDLPCEFPYLASIQVPRHNLPGQLSSFIGRENEIQTAMEHLASTRLLSLVGPGGVGKTRLAVQIGQQMLFHFLDGVWWVGLDAISDEERIPAVISSAVGISDLPNQSVLETLVNALYPKSLLLILDNCEHIVDASVLLVQELLSSCPELCILVTSREALGIDGETILRVPSMNIPAKFNEGNPDQDLDNILGYEGIRLFAERVRSRNPDFQIYVENASYVTRICKRLDGIPLALELAAARVPVIGVEKIADRLDDIFRVLGSGKRTTLPRHQTIQAAVDWSYNLLTMLEKILFRRLSVFSGGWTLEAAEAICCEDCPEGIETDDFLDTLSQLVNKSLVNVDQIPGGSVRYRFLQTVRQYALQKLVESEEGEILRNRHHEWFVNWVEDGFYKQKNGQVIEWIDQLEANFDNLRAAREWAMETGQGPMTNLRLASGLHRYWWFRGSRSEGKEWLREGLSWGDDRIDLAELRTLGFFTASWIENYFAESPLISFNLAEECVSIARQLNTAENSLLVEGLAQYAMANMLIGSDREALQFSEEAVSLGRKLSPENKWSLALALWVHSVLAKGIDDYQTAIHTANESWNLFLKTGDHWNAGPLITLGEVAIAQRNYESAHLYFDQALSSFTESRDQGGIYSVYTSLFRLAVAEGDFNQASSSFKYLTDWLLEQGNLVSLGYFFTGVAVFRILMFLENPDITGIYVFKEALTLLGASTISETPEVKEIIDNVSLVKFIQAQTGSMLRSTNRVWSSDESTERFVLLEHFTGDLGPEGFEKTFSHGTHLPPRQAIELAYELLL